MSDHPQTIVGYERSDRRQENLEKIASYADLEHNWDGTGSVPFSEDVLTQAENVIKMLKVQPEVYPSLDGSIQFDFTNFEDFYFEVSIGSDYYEIYVDDANDKHYKNLQRDTLAILQRINETLGISH